MNTDDPLLSLLSELPAADAPEGFTERLLDRYAARRRRRPFLRGLAAVLLLAALGLGWHFSAPRPGEEPALESLQAEQRALAAELAEIEELAWTTRPVAWVRTDEDLDVVLDLRGVSSAGGLDVRPAGYSADRREP